MIEKALLIPFSDPIKSYKFEMPIIEGSEDNVLSRYFNAQILSGYKYDYIVRVTGDCPFLPMPIIKHHIETAIAYKYDYLSNVDEECRTSADGHDCEVISKKAFMWLNKHAKGKDREHVTTLIRKKDHGFKMGIFMNWIDCSSIKLSVDTVEDLKNCEKYRENLKKKAEIAMTKYGEDNIFAL